jgi:hypothetical protein
MSQNEPNFAVHAPSPQADYFDVLTRAQSVLVFVGDAAVAMQSDSAHVMHKDSGWGIYYALHAIAEELVQLRNTLDTQKHSASGTGGRS